MNNDDHALSLPVSGLEDGAPRAGSGSRMAALLEHVPCELCGSAAFRTLFTVKETRSWWIAKCNDDPRLDRDFEFPVVECAECRHVFVSPRLDAQINAEIYARYWREAPTKSVTVSEYADYVCRELAVLGNRGRLLDFGCGWQAVGLEVDPRKIDFCRERGFEAVLGDLRDRPFPEASFDAAVAEQVFEHLYSPVEYMRELNYVLKPGGVVYVAVPNLGSVEAKWKGRRWDMVHPASHVRYFDRAGLAGLLSRCGFEVVPPAYVRRFERAPIKNVLHGVKTFLERNLGYYPLGLGLFGRKVKSIAS